MLVLLSPAKSLNFDDKAHVKDFTQPILFEESLILIDKLKKLSAKKVGELMSLSSDLATLNYDRFQSFSNKQSFKNSKQCLWAFTGEVYRGLDAASFTTKNIQFAQGHLRILSGLYGVLKPLDLIQPYRLEMGTKFKFSSKANNLYQFWDDKITMELNNEAKGKAIINLASSEYYKSVREKMLTSNVITPVFKEFKNGQYKVVMTYAKNARGTMANYIIKKQLTNTEKLKLFNENGYSFDIKQSSEKEWVFVR